MMGNERSGELSPQTSLVDEANLVRGTPAETAFAALREAEERRLYARQMSQPTEKDGRGGLDPVRYGDWEVRGLASDF